MTQQETASEVLKNDANITPLVDLRNLKVHFPITSGILFARTVGHVKAVDDVSLHINPGETLGLVGESGSGKTTLGRAALRLVEPTAGEVIFDGEDLTKLSGGEMRHRRRQMGIVFQDPYGSLNPRMTAGSMIGEPLKIHKLHSSKADYKKQIGDLLEIVGLSRAMADRYPHEFSGGQRQRIGVARALAGKPRFLVLDEPVSALDVSIQAQLINLLQDLQDEFNLTYLLIAHDLSVVRHISDRIAVMYLGKVVEIANYKDLYDNPLHPYTQALLSAIPLPDRTLERSRERIILKGDIPSPRNPPSGCVFHTRCPIAVEECKTTIPTMREIAPEHHAACIQL
ncbi:MAG: ATP-binding cassette domain-containing protein [Chloroflexi bacterium]|nr:ATP-binding cassette domain-containing protein [Chloroflexota bacterium]